MKLPIAEIIERGGRERLEDVLADRLVERLVFLLRDVILGPKPDRLLRVDELPPKSMIHFNDFLNFYGFSWILI